jgi:hypothetical protein
MGLGLAIVRRLASLLQHPLWLDSRPGRGSRFVIELPRALPANVASTPFASVASSAGSLLLAGGQVAVIR